MPTRVLICGMPRLLMDVVAAILAQAPGVVVVAQLDGAADVTTVVSTLQPDVVVLEGSEVPGLGSHAALFAAREGLRPNLDSDGLLPAPAVA
jgi:chemotaxis response regulator CheB